MRVQENTGKSIYMPIVIRHSFSTALVVLEEALKLNMKVALSNTKFEIILQSTLVVYPDAYLETGYAVT